MSQRDRLKVYRASNGLSWIVGLLFVPEQSLPSAICDLHITQSGAFRCAWDIANNREWGYDYVQRHVEEMRNG